MDLTTMSVRELCGIIYGAGALRGSLTGSAEDKANEAQAELERRIAPPPDARPGRFQPSREQMEADRGSITSVGGLVCDIERAEDARPDVDEAWERIWRTGNFRRDRDGLFFGTPHDVEKMKAELARILAAQPAYQSVTELAANHPNLLEYLKQLEAARPTREAIEAAKRCEGLNHMDMAIEDIRAMEYESLRLAGPSDANAGERG